MTETAVGQLTPGAYRSEGIDAAGRRVAALVSGAPWAPVVLLLPGFTGSKEDFAPILDGIAEAGFRSVAIDLPGQYQSPAMATAAEHAPDPLGRVVLDVVAALGGRAHLLGHSYGGLVARAATIIGPERISSLALLDSGPSQIPGPRRAAIEQLAPLLATGGVPLVYQGMQALAMAGPGYVPPPAELERFLRDRFLAGDPLMMQGMGDAILAEPDRVAELGDALRADAIPALIGFGVDDDVWPPATQEQMARDLGAAVAGIPAAAHSPAVENAPATLAALVSFWGAVAR